MRSLILLLVLPVGGCIINGGSNAPPVQLEVGAPDPVGFQEVAINGNIQGAVKHDVCVSADVATGFIVPVQLIDTGTYGPIDGAPLQNTPFADLDCPSTGVGWARIEWDTTTGRGLITIEHSTTRVEITPDGFAAIDAGDPGDDQPDDIDAAFFEPDAEWLEPDADTFTPDADVFAPDSGPPDSGGAGFQAFASGAQTLLEGVAFEGYDVLAGDLLQVGATTYSLPLHVDYRTSGALEASPARNVDVKMVWQPFLDSASILGGSPGVDIDNSTFRTDVNGDAYLLVSADALCYDYVLFATTPDGGTGLVTTLGCP